TLVARRARTLHDPVVDHGIARTGIEGDQRAVAADPGDISDTADIDERNGALLDLGGHRTMIGRRKWRTLTAGSAIGCTHIVNDIDACRGGERRPVADLDGQPPF